MIVPASIRRRWEKDQNAIESVGKVVWETVSTYSSKKHGVAVTGRQKDIDSIAEKLETGRFRKWSELDDLYACKIIVPTLADESTTLEFLRAAFDCEYISRRGSTFKSPEVFRFDATRFVGRLRDTGDAERTDARRIQFEVQVVTAFEHAWSTTTHALAYKSDELDWRTKRVASQLRAAVEQMDMIVLGATKSAELLTPSRYTRLDEQQGLLEGFRELVSSGVIPEELAPRSWSRFAENVHAMFDDQRRVTNGPIETSTFIDSCREHATSYGSRAFPRLISLHQFALGCGITSGCLSLPFREFTPLLSDEFHQVFPELKIESPGFDINN